MSKDAQMANPRFKSPADSSYTELIEEAGTDYSPRVTVDQVNHPPHYMMVGVEAIDITEQFNFNRGNAMKYIIRAGKKDPNKEVEDLRKAQFYLDREIKRIEGVK
jgi:hypothetical protein